MALRQGFTRYAVRFQYHGGSFLGFSQQKQEDCVLEDGTDLRGFTSVETRLRRALHKLVPSFDENFLLQVSSRTDRGVHSLGNTLHVDLPNGILTPKQLLQGWQYHLMRDEFYHHTSPSSHSSPTSRRKRLKTANLFPQGDDYVRAGPGNDVCIRNAVEAPLHVRYDKWSDDNEWNARFSATERLYVYRILLHVTDDNNHFSGAPFEWDRSWLLRTTSDGPALNVDAMQYAAETLVGEHDFSSFRAKGCQQSSPIVHVRDISVQLQPYGLLAPYATAGFGDLATRRGESNRNPVQLITISVRAKSFLYRMVRNLVGYLVDVGQKEAARGVSSSEERIRRSTRDLLEARDRNQAPRMAPAQGLFLVHVQHGDFDF